MKTTKYQDKLSKAFNDMSLQGPKITDSKDETLVVQGETSTRPKINKYVKDGVKTKKKLLVRHQTDHAKNSKGHVTLPDIEAMKRWFNENWKTSATIPFQILTLESFLITYFGYTYNSIQALSVKKREAIETNYKIFLSKIGAIMQTRLFNYENLKPFMDMCKRNFQKQKAYNRIIQAYITEKKAMRMGYLIDANLYIQLSKDNHPNLKIASSTTRYNAIITWLSKQKLVYVPVEFREKLNIEADMDMFENINDIRDYLVGFGSYNFTDIKLTELGITGPSELAWFVALNNYVNISPILTLSPQIKNFEYEPHLTTLTYTTAQTEYSIEVILLVDWAMYNKYRNASGVMNLSITKDTVMINSEVIPTKEEDINKLTKDLTIAIHRMTGAQILADLTNVKISVRRTLEKMGSFMAKMTAARNLYLETSKGVYKMAMIAGKASGKTTIINLVRNQLSSDIYIEDSDDYGKFLTMLVSNHGSGDIDFLDSELSDEQIMLEAKNFAAMNDTVGVDNIPSYFNLLVSLMIRDEVNQLDWASIRKADYSQLYEDTLNKLYIKHFPHIKDIYYRWSSGQSINERLFENGIYQYLEAVNKRIYIAFFHIFSSNYKRKPSNLSFRYEPNFNTNISLYKRMIDKNTPIVEALTESLLKMYYDQAAEHVTTVAGPSAFMGLFGLVPVLSCKSTLCFEFKTHLDITE